MARERGQAIGAEGNGHGSDFSVKDLVKTSVEKRGPISYEAYVEKLNSGEATTPRNSYDFIYAGLTRQPPVTLPTGNLEYPVFAKRTDGYAVFGLYCSVSQVVEFVHRGKETGGKKTGLMLVGDSGAGKTMLVEVVKRATVEQAKALEHPNIRS